MFRTAWRSCRRQQHRKGRRRDEPGEPVAESRVEGIETQPAHFRHRRDGLEHWQPQQHSSCRIDHVGDARIGDADEKASILDRPPQRQRLVLERRHRVSEPAVVRDGEENFRRSLGELRAARSVRGGPRNS